MQTASAAMEVTGGAWGLACGTFLPDEAGYLLGNQVPRPSRLGPPDGDAMLVEQIVLNPMLDRETIGIDGFRMAVR